MELIWPLSKGIAARNTTYRLADVETIRKQKTATVTAETWSGAIRHVVFINAYSKRYSTIRSDIQPIFISLDEEDTSY